MVATPVRPTSRGWVESIWSSYLAQLKQRPLQSKALTSAVILSMSDIISQLIGGRPFSIKRNIFVAIWGYVWAGPSAHYWQGFMHKLSSKTDIKTVLMKVIIDQVTYGPVNNIANMTFFALMVESKGWKHLIAKIMQDYPAVQLNGWKLWPAAAMLNYRYVPLNLRVLFLNVVALGWSTFLNASATYKPKVE